MRHLMAWPISWTTFCRRCSFSLAAVWVFFFFFQAEDGIRDTSVTGVQTCALPIFGAPHAGGDRHGQPDRGRKAEQGHVLAERPGQGVQAAGVAVRPEDQGGRAGERGQIGRASCRERVEITEVAGSVTKKEWKTRTE